MTALSLMDKLKAQYMTPENLAEYKATQDKYLFVEYLTDLPNDHPIVNALDEAFWIATQGE